MVEEMVEDAMVDVAEGTEETAEMVGLKWASTSWVHKVLRLQYY